MILFSTCYCPLFTSTITYTLHRPGAAALRPPSLALVNYLPVTLRHPAPAGLRPKAVTEMWEPVAGEVGHQLPRTAWPDGGAGGGSGSLARPAPADRQPWHRSEAKGDYSIFHVMPRFYFRLF